MSPKLNPLTLPGRVFHRFLRAAGIAPVPAPVPPLPPLPDPAAVLAAAELESLRALSFRAEWAALEEQALELLTGRPDRSDVMEMLAYALQQQGKVTDAFAWASKSVEITPSSWTAQFVAGVSLRAMNQDALACEYLRSAAALAPGDRQTLRQLVEAVARTLGLDAAASEHAARRRDAGDEPVATIAPLMSVREWAAATGQPLLEAGEAEEVPFTTPRVWGGAASAETTLALSNKPYVATIYNARVLSGSSIVLAADGTALNDSARDPRFGRHVSLAYDTAVLAQEPDRLLLDLSEFRPREIEAGIALCGLASDAYGHWFPEFLPKLMFLRQHPDFAQLPIIVDAGMPPSHIDHLRRLADNPLIMLERGESLACGKLLVAPTPCFAPVELFPNDVPVRLMPGLSPRAMRFVGGEVPPISAALHRRLFLARKNMRWRRLLNEADIIDVLTPMGFETVFMEELSMSEQVALLRSAAWIVAPNGSALLNIVFCQTDVNLLVLTQPGLFNWGTFQGPMEALGYRSMCVSGEFAIAEDQKHSDYWISPDAVRDALFSMGLQLAERPLT